MKRISLFLVVAILMTVMLPSVSFATTLSGCTVADNEYYYENFDGYTGEAGWFDTNGYYSAADEIFSKYTDAANGTGLKIVNKTKSFKSFNGPRGDADTYFDVSPANFEDSGATLIFTADVLIKDELSVDGSGLYINLHALKGGWNNLNSTLYSISALPMYTKHWSKGAMFFAPIAAAGNANAGWTGGNATDYVSAAGKTDGSKWVKLISAVTYDKAYGKYITTSYVDGKPIYNAATGEISRLEVPATTDEVAARESLGISVYYRANNTDTGNDEYAVVDNLAMYLCEAAIPQTGTVSGHTITIPFKNGKSFTDAAAPEIVTNGYINADTAKNAKLTDENGAEITDAVFNATQSAIEVTIPTSVGKGKKVRVDLAGVEDIAGNQVGSDTTLYTPDNSVNIANSEYYQDFDGITDLSEAGCNPGNISATDTNKTFILSETADGGKGLAVNYADKTSSKSVMIPDANDKYGFSVDAASFETAGKELEYGYDIYIPGGTYNGEQLAGYLVLKNVSGGTIQFCSEQPWLTVYNNGLKFRAINDESIKSDWGADGNGMFAANAKPGIDQKNNSVYVDYAQTESGGWISVKSRISYIKDADGTGYYMTKYYVGGEIVRNANSSPAIFKIQENIAPADSQRKYLQFALYGNNGENNPGKIIIDNMFIKVVDAEEEPIIPPTPPTPEAGGAPYYYQDFESFTGDLSAIGYSSNSESVGTLKESEKYGKGIYANYKSAEGTKNISATGVIDISRKQFEEAENAVIAFSYDMFIPSTLVGNRMFFTYVNFYDKAGNIVKYASMAPSLRSGIADGSMYFMGTNKTDDIDYATYNTDIKSFPNFGANWIVYDANSKKNYSPVESEWVNALTLISYENGYYVSRFYINGQPIINSITQETAAMRVKDNGGSGERASIGFIIQERSGALATDEQGILFDNICVRMYNGLTAEPYMQVPLDADCISIPMYNAYNFDKDDVPEYVKKAIIKNKEFNSSNIVVEKFSRDDKLLLNGTVIDGYTGRLTDNIITLSNIKERQDGERLRISLKGIESVDGKKMQNSTVLIAADDDFKGVLKCSFTDIYGDEISVKSPDFVPTDISKLKMILQGVNEATITDGSLTYTAIDGTFDFSKNPLKPNTLYTIKFDGSEYTTFRTANTGKISFSDISIESNAASVKYVNTLNEDKTVYFTVMYFNAADKLLKAEQTAKTAINGKSETLTVPIDSLSGAAYCKVMILDGLQTVIPLTAMFSTNGQATEPLPVDAIKEIEISSFNNDKIAVIKGISAKKAKQRIVAVLLDMSGELIYANDLYSADDGSYVFNINMPETSETGEYKLYVSADGKILADGKSVHYSKDSSSALELLNKASTSEEMAQVIKDNQADLEFYYDEYYPSFSDGDKLAVAALLLKEKNDLKAVNGVGFITSDKQAAVATFKKSVIVHAAALGKVINYAEIVPYFDALSSGTVYEWLDVRGRRKISTELRHKWQNGILARLKGAGFSSFEDFISKFRASLAFECIADSDGYENIKGILADYVNQGYISGLDAAYITNEVCSKLVNKVYGGFTYTKLIEDITAYYNTPDLSSNGKGNNSSGGKGGVSGTFPGKAEPPKTLDEKEYSVFRDIDNCWAKDIIVELAKRNIISGVGDDCFAPDRTVTREEFVAIIVRALNLSAIIEADLPFADVTKEDWCYDSVKIAYQHGIISGKNISEFGKGENISRQDMAVILKNVLDASKIAYEEGTVDFADAEIIAEYAQKAVKILTKMKIINGYEDNTFRSYGLATRAEASKVIYEVLKVLGR